MSLHMRHYKLPHLLAGSAELSLRAECILDDEFLCDCAVLPDTGRAKPLDFRTISGVNTDQGTFRENTINVGTLHGRTWMLCSAGLLPERCDLSAKRKMTAANTLPLWQNSGLTTFSESVTVLLSQPAD
ncbi:hypothetical protein Anapl_16247 [Anas platyrhynchos]|uniref:Uncharacterized protein n=1 Tax=Anas platyrhynchos TaxID=8839 RepID=R0K0M2_ANAPL|nr:hypothetical protein Anapl_16247 [Anas platyrhynchos]